MSSAVGSLLRPGSVAIIGASDRSRWSRTAFDNLTAHGFNGVVHLVNRRGDQVHGRPTAKSCAAIGAAVDLGIILVPADAVAAALDDLSLAHAKSAIILTSGFAETGAAGREQQDALAGVAAEKGIRLLGPNCLGFINFTDGVRAWTTPIRAPSRKEGVAIVSQSGATALFLSDLAYQQDIGLSAVVSTGNEADFDIASFIDYFVDDPSTRAIALFVETVRDPVRFVAAARKAYHSGKPIVVLKVGTSEATAKTAQAHTGALVGDDKVFDGLCRQLAIIRVRSIEQLIASADILGRTGPLRPGGLCVVSNSGGICEIAGDTADAHGISLPEIAAELVAELRQSMPDFATPHNPLDATGGIEPEQCTRLIEVLSRQTTYAAILCPWYEIPTGPEQASERLTQLHTHLSDALNVAPIPGFLVSYANSVVTDFGRSIIKDIDAPYLASGVDRAIQAIAGAMWWSERLRQRNETVIPGPRGGAELSDRPRSEWEALDFLRRNGVPVVSSMLARDSGEAIAAAHALGGPVVVKIASPDIAHKSDVGGVKLNLMGDAVVGRAYEDVVTSARKHAPSAHIDGVLVSPMRERGIELLVGCVRDPQWGLVLAVGLGGVFVEVLKDVSLRVLPVERSDIINMLGELRGVAMLHGQRGIPAADLGAVADAITAIAHAAVRLGPELEALDVNPLWVRGKAVEALDALFVWRKVTP